MFGDGRAICSRKARVFRMKSAVTEAAKLHEREASWQSHRLGRSAYRKTFITLTYRSVHDWKRCHISEFVKRMRQWMARRSAPCMYVWVGELQKRGALHYHLLVWVPRKLRLPKPDRCGWWPHGMSNIETARNPVGYMVKYATKTRPDDLKRLKPGVRLHGNGGHTPTSRVQLRQSLAPWWLRKLHGQRSLADSVAHIEAQQAWERRRIEVRKTRSDGVTTIRYVDPDLPPEGSEAWWAAYIEEHQRRLALEEQWCAYAAEYGPKGCPRYKRLPRTGGFVDLLTGEFLPTPWDVRVEHGTVMLYPKTETLQ